ncbi:hypothetical protein [Natronobiforma cellulositropha]|uniref:hypothetical protein n=1 Tax=Natronobiforma cellulositropha TaxID=1679076 RepID=UPI0021D5950F|nr:hypothetical protein [Natronobiforma cellulositropha]
MKCTRRHLLSSAARGTTVAAAGVTALGSVGTASADDTAVRQSLELLAERQVDHSHACLHALYDEREPLDAGGSATSAPTVGGTHVIWEATYEGETGYVTFDASTHWWDGPFVFYSAYGSLEAVTGTELERESVADSECRGLDEYVRIDPEDDLVTLALSVEVPVATYAGSDGTIDVDGLQTAVDDWRDDVISTAHLQNVVAAWERGEQVA